MNLRSIIKLAKPNSDKDMSLDLFKTTRFFFLLDRTLRGIRAFGLNTEGDSYYMNLPTPRGELSCTSPHSAKVNLTFIACENPVECQIKSAFLNWVKELLL